MIKLSTENIKKNTIIVGDINLDISQNSPTIIDYKNIIEMNAFSLQNNLNVATRIGNTKSSIIDHVITNKNLNCEIIMKDHMISDHQVLNIKVNIPKIPWIKEKITRKKTNIQHWREGLSRQIAGQEILSFRELTNSINQTRNEATTEYNLKVINGQHWVNYEFKKKIKERDKLYSRWKLNQNENTEKNFKKLKNEVNNLRNYLKKQYAEGKLENAGGDVKKTWKVLNGLCSKGKKPKSSINKINTTNGQTLECPTDILEETNRHFSSIGVDLASKINPVNGAVFEDEEILDSIFLRPTNSLEILEIIQDIKTNSAPGEDSITKTDIIQLFDIIDDKIVLLTNKVLSSGVFPDEFKVAKIIPLYKSGNHSDLNNYRPISILNTFSKMVEKIIKVRLIQFIEKKFNFDPYQYGFQKQSGVLGATVDLVEHITSQLDLNKYVTVVYIDLKKAFDTVDIEMLLKKLYKMGIRGVAYNLIQSYSKNRQHYTTINKQISSTAMLEYLKDVYLVPYRILTYYMYII